MRMRGAIAVSTTIGNKRPFTGTHLETTTPQHHSQDRILKQQKLLFMEFKRHMTVSQVISGLQELEWRSRPNP
jgi:hypothetical protein